MIDYRDDYHPDPPRSRIPKIWEEGLYESAYEGDNQTGEESHEEIIQNDIQMVIGRKN